MTTERRINEDINSLLKLGVPREFAEIIIFNKHGLDISAPIEAIKTEADEMQEAIKYMIPVDENYNKLSTQGYIVDKDNSHNLISNIILNDKN